MVAKTPRRRTLRLRFHGRRARDSANWRERSWGATDLREFADAFLSSKDTRDDFASLRSVWSESTDETCFEALKLIDVHTINDELLTDLYSLHRLAAHTDGEPRTVMARLADFVDSSVHIERSAADIRAFLRNAGIGPSPFQTAAVSSTLERVALQYVRAANALRIGGTTIETPSIQQALETLAGQRLTFVTGAAGVGKSAVIAATLEYASSLDWPTAVISADRLPAVTSATELGVALDLGGSPGAALAAVAAGRHALLVIDQLDALGVVSGRHPERLTVIEEMLIEARAHENLRVVIGCRQFDLDNDRTLRAAIGSDGSTIRVGPLSTAQVVDALNRAGLPGPQNEREARFLTSPLNLALMLELAQTDESIPLSLAGLYDRYWTVKRAACTGRRNGVDQWVETIDVLVDAMSSRQSLAVPDASLDGHRAQVDAMASESVVTTSQQQTGFVHETFFDYAWSRLFPRPEREPARLAQGWRTGPVPTGTSSATARVRAHG